MRRSRRRGRRLHERQVRPRPHLHRREEVREARRRERLVCVGAKGTTKGTCQVYLADGAACTSGGAPDCQFPAKCRNGKCATLDPVACK